MKFHIILTRDIRLLIFQEVLSSKKNKFFLVGGGDFIDDI